MTEKILCGKKIWIGNRAYHCDRVKGHPNTFHTVHTSLAVYVVYPRVKKVEYIPKSIRHYPYVLTELVRGVKQ